ncbi:MAG: FkbM family methyltransferase [Candidatus Dependentiae bacterium]|nr:FkbM family methyltransferase [Candidatus Dependentiae bacterium]
MESDHARKSTLSNLCLYRYLAASLFIVLHIATNASNGLINIDKKNVPHSFVPFDEETDNFVKNIFASWERETFEVFDKVKDPNGVAIDLGAWIGTTAIWLSKNFGHVIAVDADRTSLQCLKNNLSASQCSNVTICEKPVKQTSDHVVFGPRENALNLSTSHVKKESDNINDYSIQATTFKQLIYDFVYENDAIENKKISFIKCDIEGGEESILEDLLHFAYNNKAKAYISFHLDWWENKNIAEFEYLFKFFKTSCPSLNIADYIKKNPFTSILFEPLSDAGTLIKKNMPIVIIGYNQLTYIKHMVSQLEKYTTDIIIIDNNSSYEPLLNYYANDFKYTLLRQKINHGHRIIANRFIQSVIGDIHIMTDPDLKFNINLPNDFINILVALSNHFKAHKVGFALHINSDQIRTDVFCNGCTIKKWESQFWKTRLIYPLNYSLELYKAPIDTTFCLVNHKFYLGYNIRVAGNYTCLHLPWLKDFQNHMPSEEYEAYLKNNISSTWIK